MSGPGLETAPGYAPRLIAWELTRSCTLNCKHCRAAAELGPYEGELTLEEIRKVLESIAGYYKPIMILTGGEPMLRQDLLDVIRCTKERGLRPVMATCGALLTEKNARELRQAGVERISVSIDGPDGPSHDSFRGVSGAFEATLAGIHAARRADLPFQVNTTVTRQNMDQLEAILNLAVSLGAVAFHPFLLVPTGRGQELRDQLLNPVEYERVLIQIYELRNKTPIPFKPTCAPHYYRIFRQKEAARGHEVTPQTHGLDAMTRGCMGGISFAFISHVGKVQICGFLDEEAGDLRKTHFDFHEIWENSLLFLQFRDRANYKGDCGVCEYWMWCGGCRARAYGMTGDYLDEEPFCAFTPESNRNPSPTL